jgi:hypothetical protein
MRELFDEGMTLDAAARIVGLQDELATARARIDELEAQHGVLRGPDTPACKHDEHPEPAVATTRRLT